MAELVQTAGPDAAPPDVAEHLRASGSRNDATE